MRGVGRLLLAVRVDVGRLDLAGDVGVSDVVSIVAEQVVDKLVNLLILSPLRQAVEYLDDLGLRGRSFRRNPAYPAHHTC